MKTRRDEIKRKLVKAFGIYPFASKISVIFDVNSNEVKCG